MITEPADCLSRFTRLVKSDPARDVIRLAVGWNFRCDFDRDTVVKKASISICGDFASIQRASQNPRFQFHDESSPRIKEFGKLPTVFVGHIST